MGSWQSSASQFWEWVALPEALEVLPKQLKKPQLPGAE